MAQAQPGDHIVVDSNPLTPAGGWPDITVDVPNVTIISNLLSQQGQYAPNRNDILELSVTADGVTLVGFRILDDTPMLQPDTVIISKTGQ